MKYRKRILALGFAASMLLTGFQFSDEHLNELNENMKQVYSAEGSLYMNTDLYMTEEGQRSDLDLSISGNWEMILEPFALHVTADIQSVSEATASGVEVYCQQNGDDVDVYMGSNGVWKHGEIDYGREWQTVGNLSALYSLFEQSAQMQELEDRYVYYADISGTQIMQSFADEFDEEELAAVQMFLAMISLDASMEMGKQNGLVKALSLDATEGLNSMIGLLGSFGGVSLDAGVEECKLSLNVNNYNSVENISIPQEAFSAQHIDDDALENLLDLYS